MIDLTGITHHPAIEELVDVLCNKTQNTDRGFFRCEMAYFLGMLASTMRATIVTKDRGDIPVNIYALALATSGYGKGHSIGLIENTISGFKKRFLDDTLPVLANQSLWTLANDRAARKNSDPQEEFDKAEKAYNRKGGYLFSFDGGSPQGVRQFRDKLIMSDCGAISFQVDEIGLNLQKSVEILAIYLELYDQGLLKSKLTMNTNDNLRDDELIGKTPCNMLLFGTPAMLFDGGNTEVDFYKLLETGYARRCLFGNGKNADKEGIEQTDQELYFADIDPKNNNILQKWATQFHALADVGMFGWKMVVEDAVGIALVGYKRACEKAARMLPDHANVRKAEISHRYFKALKLAGALAFIDMSNEIEMDHLLSAILLVEESGEAFDSILKREKDYVRLAKYIATSEDEVTHADLVEALPAIVPTSAARRNELMSLAASWGCKNNIIIKKRFEGTIEFFKGETLKETDLNNMIFSYSDNWAYEYAPPEEPVPFDQLHLLTQAQDIHWANHNFIGRHRAEENVITGFNMLVLDVDGGISVDLVNTLLVEVKHFTYTTKRSTDEKNRFRLIIPINYILHLDKDEYKALVKNVMAWLPFETADIDDSSWQRSKKWMSCENSVSHYNTKGELLDILPFIPKTALNETYQKEFKAVASLDNLERWFAGRISNGNRNNQMIKFALALLDSGLDPIVISQQVHAFNKKLPEPMDPDRINSTIMVTVAKRHSESTTT
jgi:hypothetical protein